MNARATSFPFLVAASAMLLVGGCATGRSRQTADEVFALQRQVHALENALQKLLEEHGKHIVRSGETLRTIAQRHNLQVSDLYRMNPDLRSTIEGNQFYPGLVIVVREQKPNKIASHEPPPPVSRPDAPVHRTQDSLPGPASGGGR